MESVTTARMGYRTRGTVEELELLPEGDWDDFCAELADGEPLDRLLEAHGWVYGGLHQHVKAHAVRGAQFAEALAARKVLRGELVTGKWSQLVGGIDVEAATVGDGLRAADSLAKHVGVLRDGVGVGQGGGVPVINFVFVDGGRLPQEAGAVPEVTRDLVAERVVEFLPAPVLVEVEDEYL